MYLAAAARLARQRAPALHRTIATTVASPSAPSSSSAAAPVSLSNVEASWTKLTPEEKASVHQQLEEVQKKPWNELSVDEKKAGECSSLYLCFPVLSYGASRGLERRVMRSVTHCLCLLLSMFIFWCNLPPTSTTERATRLGCPVQPTTWLSALMDPGLPQVNRATTSRFSSTLLPLSALVLPSSLLSEASVRILRHCWPRHGRSSTRLAAMEFTGAPPPRTMTREWEEASNERAKEMKLNPITGSYHLFSSMSEVPDALFVV